MNTPRYQIKRGGNIVKKVQNVFLIPLTGFTVAVIGAVISLLSGIGTRLQWWDFRTGLSVLRVSAIVGVIAGIVSLIGVIVVLFLQNKGMLTESSL